MDNGTLKDRYFTFAKDPGFQVLQRNRYMPHVGRYVPYEVYWGKGYVNPGWKPFGMNYNVEWSGKELSEEEAFIWIMENQ